MLSYSVQQNTGSILKPAIIFRGKGDLPATEKGQYDSRILVLFQKSAWADRDICLQWVDKVLEPAFSMYICIVTNTIKYLFPRI